MKIKTAKPYAKLAECVGQKLVGHSAIDRYNDEVVLVFESAFAVVVRDHGYEGEGYLRESNEEDVDGLAYELTKVGIVSEEDYAELQRAREEERLAGLVERERKEFERLRKKFEGGE